MLFHLVRSGAPFFVAASQAATGSSPAKAIFTTGAGLLRRHKQLTGPLFYEE